MRFAKMIVAGAALACAGLSGQAQAAKIFTITGSSTGSTGIVLPYPFDGGGPQGSHSIVTAIRFGAPFYGTGEFVGEYTYYLSSNGFYDANEQSYSSLSSVAGQTSMIVAAYLRSGWQGGAHYTYIPRGLSLVLSPDNDQTSFSYTITGFHAVPEPATWALMIVGFGGIGAALRRRSTLRSADLEPELERS